MSLMDEPLMRSLMKNETFRKRFALSFMDIANTCLEYERVHGILEEWRKTYRTQVTRSHQRFFAEDFSEADFDGYLDGMDAFFKKRFDYIVPCMAQELGLSGTLEKVTVTVASPEGGNVLVNTASTGDSRTWSGFYYTDYPLTVTCMAQELGLSGTLEKVTVTVASPEGGNVLVNTASTGDSRTWSGFYYTDYPLTVTAVPEEGWEFAGWSGAASGRERTQDVTVRDGGVRLHAFYYTDYPLTVTAVPEEGWEFAGWSGAASGRERTQDVTVRDGGVRLHARFVRSG